MIHTWERTWQYIKKAGTIILAISILFWALMAYPELPQTEKERFEQRRQAILVNGPPPLAATLPEGKNSEDSLTGVHRSAEMVVREIDQEEAKTALQYSLAGRLGLSLENITKWCGFDWRTNVALLSGFAAKELIISTMGTAYSMGKSRNAEDLPLSEQLARDPDWNRSRALALIVFIMLYAPCLATVTCIIKEAGAWKWGIFSMVFNTTVAFLGAILVYQGGRWVGIGGW
jgi:ferrous iron transport protein B